MNASLRTGSLLRPVGQRPRSGVPDVGRKRTRARRFCRASSMSEAQGQHAALRRAKGGVDSHAPSSWSRLLEEPKVLVQRAQGHLAAAVGGGSR